MGKQAFFIKNGMLCAVLKDGSTATRMTDEQGYGFSLDGYRLGFADVASRSGRTTGYIKGIVDGSRIASKRMDRLIEFEDQVDRIQDARLGEVPSALRQALARLRR